MGGTATAPEREVDVLRRGVALVVDRLPSGWQADVVEEVVVGAGGRRADAVMDLTASDGSRAVLVLEAKRSVVIRDLSAVVSQLETISGPFVSQAAQVVPVVVARYLAPLPGSGCRSAECPMSMRRVTFGSLSTSRRSTCVTPVPIGIRGAVRGDPEPLCKGLRRPGSFVHWSTSRRRSVSRSLCADPVRPPATYRVVEFLEREALIEREPRGPVVAVQWRRILERWSEDYGFQRSNTVSAYLQPRGDRRPAR